MLRVYLDEMKWIDLGRAINGNSLGKPFQTVATMVCAAVDQGQASFPLSMGHFYETWKKRKVDPRHELATTMAAISCNHAIAPHWGLLPGELDRALQRRFGRPVSSLPLQPFGRGLRHSSGNLIPEPTEDMCKLVLDANPSLSERELADVIDRIMLAGPLEDMPVEGISMPPVQPAQDFANVQNEQVRLFIEHSADKDTRRRGVAARELLDIRESLGSALARACISWEQFFELGPEGVTDFMLDLPSRAPGLELMWLQYDNQQIKWKPNDLNDIGYLSVAVGYCDVVVTERRWTHMLNQSGAAERAGTTVLSDLRDLTEVLVAQSVAA